MKSNNLGRKECPNCNKPYRTVIQPIGSAGDPLDQYPPINDPRFCQCSKWRYTLGRKEDIKELFRKDLEKTHKDFWNYDMCSCGFYYGNTDKSFQDHFEEMLDSYTSRAKEEKQHPTTTSNQFK